MMKRNLLKPLILLFALLVGGLNSVWAEDVTFTFGKATNRDVRSYEAVTKDNVKVTILDQENTSYMSDDNDVRIYSGKSFTVESTSPAMKITKMVITFTASNYASATSNACFDVVTSYSTSDTNGTWIGDASKITFTKQNSGQVRISQIVVTIESSSTTDPAATLNTASLDFGRVKYGETKELTFTVTPANLTSNLTISCDNNKYTVSQTSIASTTTTAQTITVTAAPTALDDDMDGTITISGGGLSANKTVTLTTTVTDPNANDGSVDKPYTVAEAIAATPATGTSDNVYIKGIVSAFYNTSIVGDGSYYRYYISDDGTTTNQLLVYKGKGLNDEAFSSADDLQIGDEVVILGGLTTFSNASEVASGNYIVSLTRKPLINADDVNIAFNVANGNIAYEIANPASDGELTATTTATWLTLGTATETDVPFTATTNNGTEPRSAEVTLTYTYNTNETTTKVISVTQGIAIEEAWIETTLDKLTADDVFAIVSTKGNNSYAMSNDNGTSSAPSAVKVTVVEDKLTGTIEDNIKWNVVSDKDGYVFYPNGETKTWLYCTNTNNGVRVGTGDAKHFSLTTGQEEGKNGYLTTSETAKQRYLGVYNLTDWRCYDNINTNIQGQTFAFYKKATTTSVTISEVGYKAYNTIMATDFTKTEGLQAFAVTGYSESSVTLTEVETAPAGTPLVLKAAKGDYLLNAAATTPDAPAGNKLQVSDETVGDGATIYALANVGGEPGFYVVKSGLTIPTNYIVIPAGNAPALSFDFGEGTTGINSLTPALSEGKGVYTLDGRKLNAMPTQKGVYIVNGKKVVIK